MDRERGLARLDALEGYLRELRGIVPPSFEDYQRVETRRACERLAQVAVEAALDVCALLVRELRLGVPAEEDDEYTAVDDRIVYEVVTGRIGNLARFAAEVRAVLARG